MSSYYLNWLRVALIIYTSATNENTNLEQWDNIPYNSMNKRTRTLILFEQKVIKGVFVSLIKMEFYCLPIFIIRIKKIIEDLSNQIHDSWNIYYIKKISWKRFLPLKDFSKICLYLEYLFTLLDSITIIKIKKLVIFPVKDFPFSR